MTRLLHCAEHEFNYPEGLECYYCAKNSQQNLREERDRVLNASVVAQRDEARANVETFRTSLYAVEERCTSLRTALTEFVESYKRELYGFSQDAPYATDEAYADACKLLGREP